MRYAFLIAIPLVVAAGGAYALSLRETLAQPRESCGPEGALRVDLGPPERDVDGLEVLPVFVRNEGDREAIVHAGAYGGAFYHVRWDGRLVPHGGVLVNVDHVEEDEGTRVEPGASARVGEVQPPLGVRGRTLVIAHVDDLCGPRELYL